MPGGTFGILVCGKCGRELKECYNSLNSCSPKIVHPQKIDCKQKYMETYKMPVRCDSCGKGCTLEIEKGNPAVPVWDIKGGSKCWYCGCKTLTISI